MHVNPNYDPGAIRGVVESGVRAELRRNPAVMRRLIGVGDESRLATFRVTPGEIVRVQPPRRPSWYRRLWAWLRRRA